MPVASAGTTAAEQARLRFGRVLAEALFARDLTQADLARAVGSTQSAVSAWVNGHAEPASSLVFEVEGYLELPAGFLSRLLGYLPVSAVASVASIQEAVQASTLIDEDLKPMLLAVVRELVKKSRESQARLKVVNPRARRR